MARPPGPPPPPPKPDFLAYARIGRDAAFSVTLKPHLSTVLGSLLKGARAAGIEVDDGWTIAKLREELAAHDA